MKLKFGHIKKINSISIHLFEDGMEINGVVVSLEKGEIEIKETYLNLNSITEVIKKIGNKHPFIIHFSGKGILNKQVDYSENYTQNILMNGSLSEFHLTDFKQDQSVYCSVIRKSLGNTVLVEFNKLKTHVISLSSGPFICMSISKYLKQNKINTNSFQLHLNHDLLVNFNKFENQENIHYWLGDNKVDYSVLTAISHSVLYFHPHVKFNLPNDDEISFNQEESKQKLLFYRFGIFMAIFFFTMLLANYFYLDFLNSVSINNTIVLAENQTEFDEIKKLEEEKSRQAHILKTSGVLNKKFISFYLSEISESIPKSITLSKLAIKPLKKEIKSKRKIEINNQLIQLNGNCKSSDQLSDWIFELKQVNWIRKIDIDDYQNTENGAEFKLKLVI